VPLDTHRLHYSEIAVRGAYHHRPETARRALELLAAGGHGLESLLSMRTDLRGLAEALAAMERRDVLKAVVVP
jgi:threonine dehydrogenase-like Zn-dependent dehydrogenase